jgi:hypothetical protein
MNNKKMLNYTTAQTLILMIQLAIQLWQWWKARNIDEPSTVASFGEMSAFGEDLYLEDDDE